MSAPVPVEQLTALRGAIVWLADDDSTPAPMLELLRALLASLEARSTGDEVIEPLLGWVAGIWPPLATELRRRLCGP
jgi:hypothetical protein